MSEISLQEHEQSELLKLFLAWVELNDNDNLLALKRKGKTVLLERYKKESDKVFKEIKEILKERARKDGAKVLLDFFTEIDSILVSEKRYKFFENFRLVLLDSFFEELKEEKK